MMTDVLIDHPALVAAGRLRARLSVGLSYRWGHLDDAARTEQAAERWRGLRDEYLAALVVVRAAATDEELTRATTILNEQVNRAWLGGDWEADWAEPNGRYMAAYDASRIEEAARTLDDLDRRVGREWEKRRETEEERDAGGDAGRGEAEDPRGEDGEALAGA